MSSYFLVKLQTPDAPEHLLEAHAGDGLFLNARGRPCDLSKAARLESEDLARALLAACIAPLRAKFGDELSMKVMQAAAGGAEDAQRVANDSNATRDWLVSQSAS
jgi:hypothetical protein